MKKSGIAAIAAAGVVILGGGGYALGTLTSSEPEPAANQTPTEPAATIEATAPEPEPSQTLSPDEEFLKGATRSFESLGVSYPKDELEAVGQDICEYVNTADDVQPYQTVERAKGTMHRMVYMEVWDAALFTDGFCD